MSVIDSAFAFFDDFVRVWNEQDVKALTTQYFSEPFTLVGPSGPVMMPNSEVAQQMMSKLIGNLAEAGLSHTVAKDIKVYQTGEHRAIVDCHLRRFKKDGSILEEVDFHYILFRNDGQWRIAIAAYCDPGWQESQAHKGNLEVADQFKGIGD